MKNSSEMRFLCNILWFCAFCNAFNLPLNVRRPDMIMLHSAVGNYGIYVNVLLEMTSMYELPQYLPSCTIVAGM